MQAAVDAKSRTKWGPTSSKFPAKKKNAGWEAAVSERKVGFKCYARWDDAIEQTNEVLLTGQLTYLMLCLRLRGE